MPIDPTRTPLSAATAAAKRRRETVSQGSDKTPHGTPQPPNAGTPTPTSPPNKPKRRKGDGNASSRSSTAGEDGLSSQAGDTSEPEIDLDDDDGFDEVAALKGRTQTAARLAGVQAANSRQAKFAQRYAGKSPEETLDALITKWRSSVYDHFTRPKIVTASNGAIVHRFVCKTNPSKTVDRLEYQESTGNLSRHVKTCDPDDIPEVQMIENFAAGVTYTPHRLRYHMAMWCARSHRPFTIVEDPNLRTILGMLYKKVAIPTRATVSQDVRDLHSESKERVKAHLKNLAGGIHICMDGWTAPNVISYLGITAHWHDNGKINHIILDFVKLTKAHTAVYLAEQLEQCLKDYGILEKVIGVTCDNAEVNVALMRALRENHPHLRIGNGLVRCFGHVLNLVSKAAVKPFVKTRVRKPRNTVDNDDEDQDELSESEREDEDDDVPDDSREAADDELIEDLFAEDDFTTLTPCAPSELNEAIEALEKITKLSKKVWHTPLVREELEHLADEAGLHARVLVRSVKTRWNTLVMVVGRALDMKPVLTSLCDMHQFNRVRSVRLRRFILTEVEWSILEQLYHLMDPFLFATNEISSSTRALLHEVIPFMDVLTKHLDTFVDQPELHPAVHKGAYLAREMLNKYYSKTDETPLYRIAMILHPAYKLAYFRNANWPEDWITTARELITDEYAAHYKPAPAPIPPIPASTSRVMLTAPLPGQPGTRGGARRSASATLFAALASRSRVDNAADALEEYLNSPPNTTVSDPLAYWNTALKSGSENKALAQMALDYLSIPASSTDAERAFSRGRLTVSRLRRSLGNDSVRANTILGSWARIPALVPEEEMVAFLKDKKGASARRAMEERVTTNPIVVSD